MLAICPNPTIDRLVVLHELIPGTVDRARENHAYPAGKSVSAARGAKANGADPQILVLLPQTGSGWYLDSLAQESFQVAANAYPGVVRESIIVLEDAGRVTVLNGTGAQVSSEDWESFLAATLAAVRPGGWVICSGSFPPGVGPQALSELVVQIKSAGGRLALDTGPAWMPYALAGAVQPSLITPNLAEAEAILGSGPGVENTWVDADALTRAESVARELQARGIESVVVTAGSAGLAWASVDGSGALVGQQVSVRNPIGAGDAFLGGLVARLEQGLSFADAVAWGMATSCAAIEQWSPGRADPARVAHYEELITAGR